MGAVAIEQPVSTSRLGTRKVRDSLAVAARISRQVFGAMRQKNVLVSMVLVLALVASSIGVVVSAHENRKLFNSLSYLQAARDQYQQEWSQLLLEQSALSAHSRVESLASSRFGMIVPRRQDIVLVPLMSPAAVH